MNADNSRSKYGRIRADNVTLDDAPLRLTADVTDLASVAELVRAIRTAFGGVDGLVGPDQRLYDDGFVHRYSARTPLGRMARRDE